MRPREAFEAATNERTREEVSAGKKWFFEATARSRRPNERTLERGKGPFHYASVVGAAMLQCMMSDWTGLTAEEAPRDTSDIDEFVERGPPAKSCHQNHQHGQLLEMMMPPSHTLPIF